MCAPPSAHSSRWNNRTSVDECVRCLLYSFLQVIFHRGSSGLLSVWAVTFLMDAPSGTADQLPMTHFSESLRSFWDRRYILLH